MTLLFTLRFFSPSTQLRFWQPPAEPGAHDPRGCPSYVKEYVEPFASELQRATDPELSTSGLSLSNGEVAREIALGGGSNAHNVVDFGQKRHLPHPNMVHPPSEDAIQQHLGKILSQAAKREARGEGDASPLAASQHESDSGVSSPDSEPSSVPTAGRSADGGRPTADSASLTSVTVGEALSSKASEAARAGVHARLQEELGAAPESAVHNGPMPQGAAVIRKTPLQAVSPAPLTMVFSVQDLLKAEPEKITSV